MGVISTATADQIPTVTRTAIYGLWLGLAAQTALWFVITAWPLVLAVPIAAIFVGVVAPIIFMISRGANWARLTYAITYAVLCVQSIPTGFVGPGGIFTLLKYDLQFAVPRAIFEFGILLAVVMLFVPPSNNWFRRRPPPDTPPKPGISARDDKPFVEKSDVDTELTTARDGSARRRAFRIGALIASCVGIFVHLYLAKDAGYEFAMDEYTKAPFLSSFLLLAVSFQAFVLWWGHPFYLLNIAAFATRSIPTIAATILCILGIVALDIVLYSSHSSSQRSQAAYVNAAFLYLDGIVVVALIVLLVIGRSGGRAS